MTLPILEWLPPDAFTVEAVQSAASDIIAAWSRRWFTKREARVAHISLAERKARIAQSLRVGGYVSEAELSGHGKRNLLEAILGVELSGVTLSANDHKLLDALATAAIKDLLDNLDGLGESSKDETLLALTLAVGEKEAAVLVFPCHFLIPAIKAGMEKASASRQVPKSRAEALKPTRLVAEGILGSVEISLEDLNNLAVGDVVVLDSLIKNPVELRLRSSGRRIGRGRLARTGGRASIQF